MPKDPQIKLIHRLNRIQGQIGAIKKILATDYEEQDCVEVLRLVKAVNNATKKFGEAYVSDHLRYCVRQDVPKEKIEEGLQEIISSAFSL